MSLVLAPVTITRDHFGDQFLHNDLWYGYPVTGRISSPQGLYRPAYGTTHQAIDIAAPFGMPIRAPAPGKVVFVQAQVHGTSKGHALGNFVLIEHANGWQTLYAHMENNGVNVWMGRRVERGDIIGKIGVLGNTTGPHLHFGVATKAYGFYKDSPYLRDPERLIRAVAPLAHGAKPPVDSATRMEIGIDIFGRGILNPIRVDHSKGIERWLYEYWSVRGNVTS